MTHEKEAIREVGIFRFEVFGSGRRNRYTSSKFNLRCDAIGLHEREILLLSVIGPETSVKALTAGLRSSGRDQKRIEYSASVGGIEGRDLGRCSDGYRVYRAKLDYDHWHVLFLAKREGFMPVLTDEALWRHLQGEQFTTPLLREWIPWLKTALQRRESVVCLDQSGCQAGIVLAENSDLDELVSQGLKNGSLTIGGLSSHSRCRRDRSIARDITNLDQYMLAYGALLGKQAERSLNPLHVPSRDQLPTLDLNREPFEAQAHVIESTRKALQRQKALMLVGEMGVGKTLMAMAAIHAHALGQPYRALVFCPGQLVNKWEREIRETVPGAEVIQIESWRNLLHLDRNKKPSMVQWFIIARDRAKLGALWQPAYCEFPRLDSGFLRCPNCGLRIVTDKREPLRIGRPAKDGQAGTGLWKIRAKCEWVLTNDGGSDTSEDQRDSLIEGCGSPLWQMNGQLRRYEPALFIKRHLRNYFKYLILDEVHEEKGSDTAQGNAAGALASCCRKVIALTGTLIGGYSEHLRPLLFRLAPRSLVNEGLGWSSVTAFNERYGRIETRITEKSGVLGEDNRMSRGSKSTTKSVRPGVMPILFGKHLIDKTVFLGLSEVADNLPQLEEDCVSVRMDAEQSRAYQHDLEEPLTKAIKDMIRKGDRRLLGTMLQSLLAYPDYPFNWGPVGYQGEGGFVTVATPPSLSENVVRPKEQVLIDLVRSEQANGRKVWVYVQFTDKHDVQARLERLLKEAGMGVSVLRSSVPLARREEWIAEHAPKLDVVISHPRLVETGLDLFDKHGRHNFPTICFFETGYNLFTLRQASRRSWRIGQTESCRVVYLHYAGTMQERAMTLMGKKLTAAQALEGRFSSEGLVAMAGEDANVEIALARSLVERMDEGDARRHWSKTLNRREGTAVSPSATRRLWDEFSAPASATPPLSNSHPSRARATTEIAGMLF
jgi:type III restriction/modification enzyme restriction subunit